MSKELVTSYFAAMNNRQLDNFSDFFTEDYTIHRVKYPDLVGREDAVAWLSAFLGRRSNATFDILKVVAEGDDVVVHAKIRGLPDDNVRVIVGIYKVENNKIAEHWHIEQLEPPAGKAPEPSKA